MRFPQLSILFRTLPKYCMFYNYMYLPTNLISIDHDLENVHIYEFSHDSSMYIIIYTGSYLGI